MRKKIGVRAAVLGMTTVFFLGTAFQSYASEPPAYTKAATYVSDGWVINFWNTESDHMREELAQIAADGFNSIILAIPWREFQPTVDPVTYSDYTFQKLERIMQEAAEQGLWVQLRLSYTWDYYGEEESAVRFRDLLEGGTVRSAWLSYIEQIYKTVTKYPNFYGAFLTWEDFWNYVEAPPVTGSNTASRKEAEKIGYQDYLKEYYTLEQINEYYNQTNEFTSYEEVYIPHRESPAYKLFYEFYDEFLIELLAEAQQIFPELSMEIRLDIDPVNGISGGQVGAHHFRTFPCGSAPYTALMYSVSMGQENKGEQITADHALSVMENQLNLVHNYNGRKPIFIDQFLYMDATEAFSHNAKLYEEERNQFLLGSVPVLKKFSSGYGVWSYYNYANNPVYNCQFALGERGWITEKAEAEEYEGSSRMHIRTRGTISQKIGHRIGEKQTHHNYVCFIADSEKPVLLSVTLGNMTKRMEVHGHQEVELDFGRLDYDEIQFRADGDVYLDNIEVYNFIQDGGLYDRAGRELGCISTIRELNKTLP